MPEAFASGQHDDILGVAFRKRIFDWNGIRSPAIHELIALYLYDGGSHGDSSRRTKIFHIRILLQIGELQNVFSGL